MDLLYSHMVRIERHWDYTVWKENKTKVYSLSEAHEIKESKEIITGHKAEIRKITEITEIIA